eukprot:scaffold23439_cov69-Skeletonema_menzelii.AAC.1
MREQATTSTALMGIIMLILHSNSEIISFSSELRTTAGARVRILKDTVPSRQKYMSNIVRLRPVGRQ